MTTSLKQDIYSYRSKQREVYRDTGLPQETKKTQINNLTYHLKELKNKRKGQSQQKEGNNKNLGGSN